MSFIVKNLTRRADIFGKYVDQPALIKKVSGRVPAVLIAGATAFGLYDTFNNKKVKDDKESKLSRFVKNASILTGTVASTLIFGKKFIHMPHHCGDTLEKIIAGVKDKGVTKLLNRMKDGKILKHEKVKEVYEYFEKQGDKGKELMSKVFPIGHSHEKGNKFWNKHPEFAEIKDLSVLGTIPVLGGIAGGIVGDKLTGEDLNKTVPDKIKEGAYQYLANIILCNVGAGAALFAVNRTSYKNSKPVKFGAMLVGILSIGVAGGSLIANYIGKKVINPMLNYHPGRRRGCGQGYRQQNIYNELYNERTPEALDIGLHIDDVAAAGFLSGLNIIAPVLPILYSVSAYRAGIGYRNNKTPIKTKCSRFNIDQKHVNNDLFNEFRKKTYNYSYKKA